MTIPVAGLPISFSNDDAKTNICAKTQASITALVGLVKSIVKNSHSNDHLTSTLKQFVSADQQLTSTQDHLGKIEHTCQQLFFQSDILQLDIHELTQIQHIFSEMRLDEP